MFKTENEIPPPQPLPPKKEKKHKPGLIVLFLNVLLLLIIKCEETAAPPRFAPDVLIHWNSSYPLWYLVFARQSDAQK